MRYNEILEEIYRVREEHARECGFDVHKMFEQLREGTEHLKLEGWQVVYPGPHEAEPSFVLKEELPKQ